MNLSLFVLIPWLTIFGIVFCKNNRQVRVLSAIMMSIQLVMAAILVFLYLHERNTGNTATMLFTQDYTWFKIPNIHYAIGVDGISVAMIFYFN